MHHIAHKKEPTFFLYDIPHNKGKTNIIKNKSIDYFCRYTHFLSTVIANDYIRTNIRSFLFKVLYSLLEIEQRIQALPQETKEMLMDERNDYWIRSAISEISDMIVVMRGFSLTKSVAVDLFDGSLESFFSRYMSKTEGSACSSDKAGFICRKIKESIKKNENLSLYRMRRKTPCFAMGSVKTTTLELNRLQKRNGKNKPIGLPKKSRTPMRLSESISTG